VGPGRSSPEEQRGETNDISLSSFLTSLLMFHFPSRHSVLFQLWLHASCNYRLYTVFMTLHGRYWKWICNATSMSHVIKMLKNQNKYLTPPLLAVCLLTELRSQNIEKLFDLLHEMSKNNYKNTIIPFTHFVTLLHISVIQWHKVWKLPGICRIISIYTISGMYVPVKICALRNHSHTYTWSNACCK
jgi:hypothetical protein